MRNLLVIGGSYFLGRIFVEEMASRGDSAIYVLNRGNRPLRMEGVSEIVCDRRDGARLSQVLPALEWDAVVDFCAYDPADVELLLRHISGPVRQYIYISTATVHQNSATLPMAEDTPRITGPMPGPGGDYAYKKWLTELKLKEVCESRGTTHISLRPAFVYGKYNYAPRESYFFKLLAKDDLISVPSQPQALFSMVSVWDVARISIACLGNEKVANGAYIVCSDELISYDRLLEVLETVSSKKLNVERKPVRFLEAKGVPLPFPLEEHLVYSGARLQEALGYRYMPLLEGMAMTYRWFFQERGTPA